MLQRCLWNSTVYTRSVKYKKLHGCVVLFKTKHRPINNCHVLHEYHRIFVREPTCLALSESLAGSSVDPVLASFPLDWGDCLQTLAWEVVFVVFARDRRGRLHICAGQVVFAVSPLDLVGSVVVSWGCLYILLPPGSHPAGGHQPSHSQKGSGTAVWKYKKKVRNIEKTLNSKAIY